ncbi:hypothetical protein D1007_18614 [Hordeum vulgare]|nr:hypothetical protein D1007_18614 [Hordeum vulgare]
MASSPPRRNPPRRCCCRPTPALSSLVDTHAAPAAAALSSEESRNPPRRGRPTPALSSLVDTHAAPAAAALSSEESRNPPRRGRPTPALSSLVDAHAAPALSSDKVPSLPSGMISGPKPGARMGTEYRDVRVEKSGRYSVNVYVKKKGRRQVGTFDTIEEAIQARDKAIQAREEAIQKLKDLRARKQGQRATAPSLPSAMISGSKPGARMGTEYRDVRVEKSGRYSVNVCVKKKGRRQVGTFDTIEEAIQARDEAIQAQEEAIQARDEAIQAQEEAIQARDEVIQAQEEAIHKLKGLKARKQGQGAMQKRKREEGSLHGSEERPKKTPMRPSTPASLRELVPSSRVTTRRREQEQEPGAASSSKMRCRVM